MANKTSRAGVAVGHTAGIFADMTLDGPEIGTLVIVVDRAKNLPNRKTMGKQDPYCAIRLGKEAKKTDTDRRGGQTPKWDQELRFTVHDSPDYYKLKVSIFNDDKRTDLIGEAFISLVDLIRPGGGSNDLWHQLSYKGKYAGDIRIEMTYYDLRPPAEKPSDKRRHKERTTLGLAESAGSHSGMSGPRQLGPREIPRRPLPVNPVQTAATLPAPQPVPQPQVTYHRQQNPESTPYYYDPAHHMHMNSQQDHAQPTYEEVAEQSYTEFESDVAPLHPMTPQQFRTSASSSGNPSTEAHVMTTFTDLRHPADVSQRRMSQIVYDPIYDGFPPHSINTVDDSVSPHGQRIDQTSLQYSDDYTVNDEADLGPPPPPPKHQIPSRRLQSDCPSTVFTPVPVRPVPIRPRVEERSPLQNIEHTYDPNANLPAPGHSRPDEEVTFTLPLDMQSSGRRRSSYGTRHILEEQQQQQQQIPDHEQQQSYQPLYEPMQNRRDLPKPSYQQSPERQMPPLPNRPRSYDEQLSHQNHDESASETYKLGSYAQSMPTLPQVHDESTRARPQQRVPGQAPPRKAVSPRPYQEDMGSRYPEEAGGRRLSGIPFGPGAYDVFNPASSEVTNENTPFETPEQARYSTRLRDSRAAEDLGPIVDNDGRVIDPSDHLPTSSWAPEPERKQRKPEHVIHYRTRHDARASITPGSSPSSLRMNLRKSQPVIPITTSAVRHQIHQTTPDSVRSLPNRPTQQPRVDSSPMTGSNSRQAYHRNSYHESVSGVHRPALSEYQVPLEHSHVPRGSAYPQQAFIPPGRCSQNFEDPLAAEMSMIDIGPSRGGRTAMRMSRGY